MAKVVPQWEFNLYGRDAIPFRKIEAFAIADLLADVIAGKPSSWGGILTRAASGNEWSDWARLGKDLQLQNVGFARFASNGTYTAESGAYNRNHNNTVPGSSAGGFFVLPSKVPLSVAGSALGSVATNSASYAPASLTWTPQTGTFEATRPLSSTGTSGVRNTGDPATKSLINSTLWPQGKGLFFDVTPSSTGSRISQGQAKVRVSENLQVAFYQDQVPMLERRTFVRNGMQATESWTVWQKFEDAEPFDVRKGVQDVGLFVQGGRLVWTLNDQSKWMLDSSIDTDEVIPSGASVPNIIPVADMTKLIGGSPLSFETRNIRARLEIASRDHTESNGIPKIGTVTRTVTRNNQSGTMLTPSACGNMPVGTDIPVEVTENGTELSYTATITPDATGLASPMLSQVYLSYTSTWITPTGSPIDISACVVKSTVSHAHPPIQAGCDASLTVDLSLMLKLVDDGKLDAAAPGRLLDYNGFEIKGGWKDWDGSWDTPMKPLMQGFINGMQSDQSSPNGAMLNITLAGGMMRLREPFGLVTSDDVPRDYYYNLFIQGLDVASQKAAEDQFVITRDENGYITNASPYTVPGFYGCDAVKTIIYDELGPDAADNFNGNGDAKRFLPSGHPPFLTKGDMQASWLTLSAATGQQLTAGSIQAQGGAFLMPPFGEDKMSWINKFAQDEIMLFTEIFTSRDSEGYPNTFQYLAYGGREELLATAKFHTVSANNPAFILTESNSLETRPDKDFNHILVWSNPWGAAAAPGSPAFFQGEARFRANHPRSPEKTGKRTKVIETALATSLSQARALAFIALASSESTQCVLPRYTLAQGQANLMTGDLFLNENNGQLGYEDVYFRSVRVEHSYEKGSEITWKTILTMQEVSAAELRRAQRDSIFG